MEFAGKLERESNFGPRGRCNRHNAFKGRVFRAMADASTFGWGHSCIWLSAVAGDTPHHDWYRFSEHGTLEVTGSWANASSYTIGSAGQPRFTRT